ncbi:MAG: hypothetical protein ACR2QT_14810 [Woeseiaceae bacterium]
MRTFAYLAIISMCSACSNPTSEDLAGQFDPLAERYVKLALALGEHDEYYVDAYFGPAEWREQARQNSQSLADIAAAATKLAHEVRSIDVSKADYVLQIRQDYIAWHLESLATVAAMRNGEILTFDEESQRIYGFVAPSFPVEHYEQALAEIDSIVPGDGALHERVYEFDLQFRIPADTVEAVVRAGIEECRVRTLQHMSLPVGENFVFELVTGNPWSAYNWYQGDLQGLIQVETSRPSTVFSSTRLGCHEGYPGHHTYSSLLDKNYLQDRGWIELSVLPLFSPQGIIFEGSGNLAESVAFPGDSKTTFLREVIVPIAGLGDIDFETRQRLTAAKKKIEYAGIEAARKYLDGDWDRAETEDWLINYALTPPENIDAWFGFTERYRAYRINYVLGEQLVEDYVRRENPSGSENGDWQALAKLLSYPPTPLLLAED